MLLRPASEALLRNGDAGLLPERQGQSREPERPVPQVILARRGALDPRGHAVSLIVKCPSVVGNMGSEKALEPRHSHGKALKPGGWGGAAAAAGG